MIKNTSLQAVPPVGIYLAIRKDVGTLTMQWSSVLGPRGIDQEHRCLQAAPPAEIYSEICKDVDDSGNVEVFSRDAFSALIKNIEAC